MITMLLMKPAVKIIKTVFGGTRPMARLTGYPSGTINSWRIREQIPAKHHQPILDCARDNQIDLEPSDFFEAA